MSAKQSGNTFWQRWISRRIPAASQVRLDNAKIFIAPSAVGYAFGVALFLLLLAAINYQNSLAYGLTFLLGALFVVSILHTYRNLAGLHVQGGAVEAIFAGQQAHFLLHLNSTGRAHYALALGWNKQALQWANVAAQGGAEVCLALASTRRGWLKAPRLRIESSFPLGLLKAWTWLDLQQQALVYPQPLDAPVHFGQGANEDQDEGRQVCGHGVDDFQGLRSYVPGDSRRRLHWKAYSKGQGLLVKDFSALVGEDFALDFNALSGDLESRLSVLCHWVLALSKTEQRFSLRLPNGFIAPAQGAAHREQCLRQLALFGVSR